MVYKSSKIRAHEVVARSDVEFSEKKVYSPRGVLYVYDPENGLTSTVLLHKDQNGSLSND